MDEGEIKSKIKQSYRLNFMKDVFARTLEDSTISTFNSMVQLNNITILNAFQTSPDFLTRLFSIFESSNKNVNQKRDGVKFIHEITLISKNLQNSQKKSLFTKMVASGLFKMLEFSLSDTSKSTRMLGSELLLTFIDADTTLIRNFPSGTEDKNASTFLQTLVDLFFSETDIGLRSQCIETLKYMLDTPIAAVNGLEDSLLSWRQSQEKENEAFVSSFYSSCGQTLFFPLKELGTGSSFRLNQHLSLLDRAKYELLCDLLSFCIVSHRYRCREFSIENRLWFGVKKLITCPHQAIQLAALRCLKQAILLDDISYAQYFSTNGLIEAMVDALVQMGNKNNLVNSACLDILELFNKGTTHPIKYGNTISLIAQLVPKLKAHWNSISYISVASMIVEQYEAYLEDDQTVFLDYSKYRGITTANFSSMNDTSPILPPDSPENGPTIPENFKLDVNHQNNFDENEIDMTSLVPYSDSDEEEDPNDQKDLVEQEFSRENSSEIGTKRDFEQMNVENAVSQSLNNPLKASRTESFKDTYSDSSKINVTTNNDNLSLPANEIHTSREEISNPHKSTSEKSEESIIGY